MRVLITGMTAPQASEPYSRRNTSFAGLMRDSLVSSHRSVDIKPPSVRLSRAELDEYDIVLVGLAPLTSMAANYVYGALWVMDLLWSSPKLHFFIDAPDPVKIAHSLRAVKDDTGALLKVFYSNRPEYALAVESTTAQALRRSVVRLSDDTWPRTLYPALPWGNDGLVTKSVLMNIGSSLAPVNLDSMIFANMESAVEYSATRERFWVTDDVKSPWSQQVEQTLSSTVRAAKLHKGWSDLDVVRQMSTANGTLVAPKKSTGSWWTPRVAQSLVAGTPVVTDWRQSAILGEPWLDLAATVDEMSDTQRARLAVAQRRSYISIIPPSNKVSELLLDLVFISR